MATTDSTTQQPAGDAALEAEHQQRMKDGEALGSMEEAESEFDRLAREAFPDAAAPTPAPKPQEAAAEPAQAPAAPAPSPAATPAPAQASAPATATPAAPAAPLLLDPNENVPITRKDFEELRNGLKVANGRVAALQRTLATSAAAATTAQGGAAPSKEAVAAAQGDTKKWDKIKADFPEWAEALDERIGAMEKPGGSSVDMATLRTELRDEMVRENIARRDAAIEEEHPGWVGKMASPQFREWWNGQPDDYRVRTWNSHSELTIIRMLDKYDAHVQQSAASAPAPAPAAATRTSSAPAVNLSAAVTKRGSAAIPASNGEELTGKAYWDYVASQEAATK